MSLGLYDYERRRRRRFWARTIKVLAGLAVLLGVGLFAYQMGIERVKGQNASLSEDIKVLQRENQELQKVVAVLQGAVREAEVRADELATRLERDLPRGELARLTKLVGERLAAGVDPNRLTFVLNEISATQNCEPPESKRFILPTPLQRSANASISFGGNALSVTGEGVSARSPDGKPENWFDPLQPVTIRMVETSGKQSTVQGLLPLQHSMVVGTTEYRFRITAGARSFVEVTTERCPFP